MSPKLLDPRPYFADLADPRRETRNKLHSLHDILMIVLCAVLSGIEDWVGMETFGKEKEAWLRTFLTLANGIPAHDTLSDVIGRLNPDTFAEAFQAWATAALAGLSGEQVCVDGKTLRGSRDGATPGVHLISAFASRARWVLAQQTVGEKTNEITAIPDLLGLLDLHGATVSLDAMGCQKAIARTLVAGGADYVLALKDNHPTLHAEVTQWLDYETARGALLIEETIDKAHGRLEIRRVVLSERIAWLEDRAEWAGLKAVGRVESIRLIGDHSSTETREFLCSFTELPRFAAAVRQHWSIENQQHWILDVQFGEDACRTRRDHSPENLAMLRRMALNLLQHNGPPKDSLRQRKIRAALNDNYRMELLLGEHNRKTI
ncbi:Predicted transposase YbfD/YdcC associated with H repeats [Allochromatium warmingii]|uniref:Predicted transposase YbfD/YdcC associated with H repeats n=2 Tax=Allochromatium warmingii TaxID=61595 RepID=A0A1H3HS31_ALLWA|nr:ISAs1 family transposase [Allochromatium warmingii]SDY18277.1 Predicted transposase YbfD/YdcC associated with H repeats [Allochromatium warmingii]